MTEGGTHGAGEGGALAGESVLGACEKLRACLQRQREQEATSHSAGRGPPRLTRERLQDQFWGRLLVCGETCITKFII